MIVSDDGFYRELSDNKICTITGRLGSGKTLIALDLSAYYLERGYSLITNTSTSWADDPDRVMVNAMRRSVARQKELNKIGSKSIAPIQVRAVSLVDEGGLYARSPALAEKISSFARKTDQIIIFAGKKLPHASLCDLQVVMWFDFFKNFLIPVKVWQWSYRLSSKKVYYGKLIQTSWKDLYGIYSTIDPADNADKIVAFSVEAAKKLFAQYGRAYELSGVEKDTKTSPEEAMAELAQALADVVELGNAPLQVGQGRRGK